jgi:hypothetical protein
MSTASGHTNYSHAEVEAAVDRLIQYQAEANERGEWTFFVDSCYTPDSVYICEYGGVLTVRAEGIAQIKATHYGSRPGQTAGRAFL